MAEMMTEKPHLPAFYHEINRHHSVRTVRNGVVDGQPYPLSSSRTTIKFSTRILASTDGECMMPVIRIRKKDENYIEACLELYFAHRPERSLGLKGKDFEGEPPRSFKTAPIENAIYLNIRCIRRSTKVTLRYECGRTRKLHNIRWAGPTKRVQLSER